MFNRRLVAAVLAVADAAMVVAGVLVAIRRSGSGGSEDGATIVASLRSTDPTSQRAPVRTAAPTVSAEAVRARPWPDRVKARGSWSATMAGSGDLVRMVAPTVVRGGLEHATLGLRSSDPRPYTRHDGVARYSTGTPLVLPDGTRWFPLENWHLTGGEDVALQYASARGTTVTGSPQAGWLEKVLASGAHTAQGQFVQRDGQTASMLDLPAGTRVSGECSTSSERSEPPRLCATSGTSFGVTIAAPPGLRLDVTGSAPPQFEAVEVEVAGTARLEALGRTWEGITGSVEGNDLRATVTRDGALGTWTVTASARSARQVWVDVWPVVDSTLTARGEFRANYSGYPLRLVYGNTGAATAQIMEVVAVGGDFPVDLGINRTRTHDAGLGVHRGGVTVNVGPGRGIDSHLPPTDEHDRGLSYRPQGPVTLIIRGNFPEVRVRLPVPSVAT